MSLLDKSKYFSIPQRYQIKIKHPNVFEIKKTPVANRGFNLVATATGPKPSIFRGNILIPFPRHAIILGTSWVGKSVKINHEMFIIINKYFVNPI